MMNFRQRAGIGVRLCPASWPVSDWIKQLQRDAALHRTYFMPSAEITAKAPCRRTTVGRTDGSAARTSSYSCSTCMQRHTASLMFRCEQACMLKTVQSPYNSSSGYRIKATAAAAPCREEPAPSARSWRAWPAAAAAPPRAPGWGPASRGGSGQAAPAPPSYTGTCAARHDKGDTVCDCATLLCSNQCCQATSEFLATAGADQTIVEALFPPFAGCRAVAHRLQFRSSSSTWPCRAAQGGRKHQGSGHDSTGGGLVCMSSRLTVSRPNPRPASLLQGGTGRCQAVAGLAQMRRSRMHSPNLMRYTSMHAWVREPPRYV